MRINNPYDALELIRYISHRKRENFGIILTNYNREVITKKVMFVGTTANCIVGIRELLVYALKKDACKCILFHNHPAGNCEPSVPDINTTKKFLKGCKSVGIELLDHIIVGKDDYYSFKEHDMIKSSNSRSKKVANKGAL
jgi:DNA repair protein RadC